MASLPLLKLAWDWEHLSSTSWFSLQDHAAPNVVVLVFDALSATNMSLYGYPRETTPNLSRMAQNATIFYRHYAGGNFTSPGTATLLTGTLPWTHRAFHLYGTVTKQFEDNNIFKIFSDGGYQTMAFTHNELSAVLLYQFREYLDSIKFAEQFFSNTNFEKDHTAAFLSERVIEQGHRGVGWQLPSSLFLSLLYRLWRTRWKTDMHRQNRQDFPRGLPAPSPAPDFYRLEDEIDWVLDQITASSTPYLRYYHFLPPHEPYNPRREFIGIFDDDGYVPVPKPQHHFSNGYSNKVLWRNRKEYDEYIAYVDSQCGRFFDSMQQRGLLENTFLVITSDHGEMFERGILEHITPTLFEPITHIPLIIWRPGQQEQVEIKALTNNMDLMPSLLSAAGLPIPPDTEGEVLPTFSQKVPDSQRSVYTIEAKSNPKNGPLRIGTVAMVKDRYKLIHYFGHEGYEDVYEMYDLINDPEELDDLYSSQSVIAKDLQDELKTKMEEVNQPYESS
jgi:arylsulfatase A-like enzyme